MIKKETIHYDLNEEQQLSIKEHLKTHSCHEFKVNSGGFGSTSKIAFIVGSCSIGPTLQIYCPYCKYTKDITDVSNW